ncbi:MAG: anthranilate synthase component I family protein [Candidatus Melainabacteria bacterium]|nr:MAG: anthranilate synthase component I family protein [Candidatus Melainabacteria bacterium]
MNKSGTQNLESDIKTAINTAVITVASDFGTPVSVFHNLSQLSKDGFLFESTEGDGRLARFSLVGIDPIRTISLKDGVAETADHRGQVSTIDAVDPIELLRLQVDEFVKSTFGSEEELRKFLKGSIIQKLELPFIGGLVGYMGYGVVTALENIPRQQSAPYEVPDARYGLYDSVVIFDQQYRKVSFVSHRGEAHARQLLEQALSPVKLPPQEIPSQALNEEQIFHNVTGPFSEKQFTDAVAATKEFIAEGQAFQIVLSQRFSAPCSIPAINIYRALQATNPSPYAYFLKCPDFVYLGSSPETFVRSQNGHVLLRAIAGTRPRGVDDDADHRLAQELKADEKEMAEHRMLVDLGRNDLGRVCTAGTVKVGEIACLTRYTHVMHLFTEVYGVLSKEKTCFDAFRSCFPAGTVSGAPKIRAMQLLSKLEPEQRGIYSGAVGYFDLLGNMDGAIAIRSALVKDNQVHVNAGAGIVYDSDPTMEYRETRNKAKSLLQAVKYAEVSSK